MTLCHIDTNPPDIPKKIIWKFMNVWWTKKRWILIILIPSLSLCCVCVLSFFVAAFYHIRQRAKEKKKFLSECFICCLRCEVNQNFCWFFFLRRRRCCFFCVFVKCFISLLYFKWDALNTLLSIHLSISRSLSSFVNEESTTY